MNLLGAQLRRIVCLSLLCLLAALIDADATAGAPILPRVAPLSPAQSDSPRPIRALVSGESLRYSGGVAQDRLPPRDGDRARANPSASPSAIPTGVADVATPTTYEGDDHAASDGVQGLYLLMRGVSLSSLLILAAIGLLASRKRRRRHDE